VKLVELNDVAYALKKWSVAEADVKKIMQKVGIMQQQESPHILQVFAFEPPGDGGGACYALLELATGGDIRTRAKSMSLEEKAAAIVSLIAALKHLHGRDFVHGDVTPGNLLVGKFGVRLCDFGAAKIADETVTHGGMTVGYAAPETMEDGIVTDRSDVFSASFVIAYIINGEPFIKEGTMPLRACRIIDSGARPTLPSNVLPQLKRLLERMWAADPKQRPTSAEAWAELEALNFQCFSDASVAAVKRLLGPAEPSAAPGDGAVELGPLRAEVERLKRECASEAAATASAQKEVADLKRQIGSLRADLETARREAADWKGRGSSIAAEVGTLKAALAKRETELGALGNDVKKWRGDAERLAEEKMASDALSDALKEELAKRRPARPEPPGPAPIAPRPAPSAAAPKHPAPPSDFDKSAAEEFGALLAGWWPPSASARQLYAAIFAEWDPTKWHDQRRR
jgi:hypothetical protein